MDKIMERIKDRLVEKDSPIKSLKALAEAIGMSEGGFYLMFKKGTMKLKTKEAICEVLGIDESYFSETSNNNEHDDSFGGGVIDKIAREMQSMRLSFEEQLKAKDQQIAGLQKNLDSAQRMLETVLGKSKGAIEGPLSPDEFKKATRTVQQLGISQVANKGIPFKPQMVKLVAP